MQIVSPCVQCTPRVWIILSMTHLLACYIVQTFSELKKKHQNENKKQKLSIILLKKKRKDFSIVVVAAVFHTQFSIVLWIVINKRATPINRLTDMCIYFIFMLLNAHVLVFVFVFAAVHSHMVKHIYGHKSSWFFSLCVMCILFYSVPSF